MIYLSEPLSGTVTNWLSYLKHFCTVPEKSLRLKLAKTTDGLQSVVCSAESVYPQPEISVCMAQAWVSACKTMQWWLVKCYRFSIICSNVSGELEGRQVLSRERDGLFDISVIAVLPLEVLNMPAEFTCELRVPRANNYTVRKEFVYYPGTCDNLLIEIMLLRLTQYLTSFNCDIYTSVSSILISSMSSILYFTTDGLYGV